MALIIQKPMSPGQRGHVKIDRTGLWKGRPKRSLVKGLNTASGRNNHGRITVRRRESGHKKLYRQIDFKRVDDGLTGVVERIEYDPNRTAFIALVKYNDDKFSYILAPNGLKIGDNVNSGPQAPIKTGNALPLINIPVGTSVHNVELTAGKGGKLARSAGTFLQIIGRETGYVLLRLPSGEVRKTRAECRATIGVLSNADNKNIKIGKAGRSRWKGVRPSVRGVAMNPIDHGHGGGEGKTAAGRHPVSPWGWLTKGKKTRKPKLSDRLIIKRRK